MFKTNTWCVSTTQSCSASTTHLTFLSHILRFSHTLCCITTHFTFQSNILHCNHISRVANIYLVFQPHILRFNHSFFVLQPHTLHFNNRFTLKPHILHCNPTFCIATKILSCKHTYLPFQATHLIRHLTLQVLHILFFQANTLPFNHTPWFKTTHIVILKH